MRVLPSAALAVAVLAGAAPASNSGAFADARGDVTLAPDIASVAVANDDDGRLTWTVRVANRDTLRRDDVYLLWLDTDLNVNTGDRGADWVVAVHGVGRRVALGRRGGRGWLFGARQETLRARWRDGLVISISREEVGTPAQVDFTVAAAAGGDVDWAPDRPPWWRFGLIVSRA